MSAVCRHESGVIRLYCFAWADWRFVGILRRNERLLSKRFSRRSGYSRSGSPS